MRLPNSQIALAAVMGVIVMIMLVLGGCSFDKLRLTIDKGNLDPKAPPPFGVTTGSVPDNTWVGIPLSE